MNTKALNVFYADMENKAVAYCEAYNGQPRADKKALKEKKDAAMAAAAKYNEELAKATYREWDKEGHAVETAIRVRYVPGTIKLSMKPNDSDVAIARVSTDNNYKANLPMMAATIGKKAFASADWFEKCEKLAYLIASRVSKHLSSGATFKYQIADASRKFSFPEGVNPMTDAGVCAALQQVYDAICMMPDEKGNNLIHVDVQKDKDDGSVFSNQWTFIREAMTREGKDLGSIEIYNTGRFTGLIADAMHSAMTRRNFSIGGID